MFWKRVLVGDQLRTLVIQNGRFKTILEPGDHTILVSPFSNITLEAYNTRELVFQSAWNDFLVKQRPAVVERHFFVIETSDTQVALIFVDGKLNRVLGPAKRLLFWRSADVRAELIDVLAEPEVPKVKLAALERFGRESLATFVTVDETAAGLLFLDNRLVRTLAPGKHAFWTVTGSPRVESVDLRLQTIEVSGQEILTKDKVSIRVTILAGFQVTDAVKAKQGVKDFQAHLHRALQLAIRQSLGRKTLEEILAEKTQVDEAVASAVRSEMAALGVRVGDIDLRDIILPGEMRDILNQVVSAEKQAQANLIRRREETAATRSLLNTAKLMEDNPILLRLKELETLEKLVEKVDRLTVNSGLDGLLNDLVSIKAEK